MTQAYIIQYYLKENGVKLYQKGQSFPDFPHHTDLHLFLVLQCNMWLYLHKTRTILASKELNEGYCATNNVFLVIL